MLKCVAVCCSVLQCVAVCSSVWQHVAWYPLSILTHPQATYCKTLQTLQHTATHTLSILTHPRAIQECDHDTLGIHDHIQGKQSALELAVIGRHRDIVHAILSTWTREGRYPDARRAGAYVGINILKHAVDCEWPDVAQLFVEAAQPLDRNNATVHKALHSCIQKRWHGCLRVLLKAGVDPAHHQPDGSIPILTACRMQDEQALRILLAAGASDLEITLTAAIFLGHYECFELLWARVVHSADLVRTAACVAALTNNLEILRVVLSAEKPDMILHRYGRKVCAIVHAWCPKALLGGRLLPGLERMLTHDISVPLMCAVSKGHFGCSSCLLQHQADPLIHDDNGLTPLTWACAQGKLDIVKVLLKRGASVTNDSHELSFMDLRKAYLRQEMYEATLFIARHNALVAPPDDCHSIQLLMTPLLVALLKGHPDVVRLLLEAGASRALLGDWCAAALAAEPRAHAIIKRMMNIAMEYEDFKTFGPFGFTSHALNFSDAPFVPTEGRLSSIIVQYSDFEWSLEAIQVSMCDVVCCSVLQ